jgi:alpha-glucoside transport system substrate-binding protein
LGYLLVSLLGCVLLSSCNGSQNSTSDQPTVTILGSITGDGQTVIEQVFAPFTEATGIHVVYEGNGAFATLLPSRVAGGNPPDVALFPQPGFMAEFAKTGDLVPLTSFMSEADLKNAYRQEWLDLGRIDDQIYALWTRADVKSLVWYRPDVFAEKGYAVPTTWQDMIALSDRIVADGGTPWCLGLESGEATGWPGTDWVEDIMLRSHPTEIYDQWIRHEVLFNSPPVQSAFETFGAIARNPDYVLGGTVGAMSTFFGDAPQPMFDNPPRCYLHRQANFIATFFPKDVTVGEDVTAFLLPEMNSTLGAPVLVGGTAFAMLNDTPESEALMKYLLTVEPHRRWVELENYVSPHQAMTPDQYSTPITQLQAKLLADAKTIRFDASDLMPGAVGTGTFWTGIMDYMGGANLTTVLQSIDDSWPEEF